MSPEVKEPSPTSPTSEPTELKSLAEPTAATTTTTSWSRVNRRSRAYGRVVALLVALIAIGAGGGYFIALGLRSPTAPKTTTPTVETLSDDQLRKLSQASSSLGTSNQILTIAANSVFQGKVNVASDLTLGGKFNANGPVALAALTVSGTTNATNLAVSQGLQVSGLTNAQNGLTVQGAASVNGNLAVSGTATVGTLSATTINAKQLLISGPLSVTHLVSAGSPVSVNGGAALGSGGTASISGNDTAGTISLAYGSNGTSGTVATVTFRSAYGTQVHVVLTPASDAAAQAQYYVARTSTGFSLIIRTPVSGPLSFDYIVVQ